MPTGSFYLVPQVGHETTSMGLIVMKNKNNQIEIYYASFKGPDLH